ncbi:MAG: hypothetical protein E7612_06540 [Ruminococcaceae bacterium]|nr:hypothetical protein [Oscillospiraceae bacterium]
MICCNKCGTVIPELKEEPKEEESSGKSSRYKKEASKEEPTSRRQSLISWPTSRAVNGFNFEEIDLCEDCKKRVYRWVNELKFRFITASSDISDTNAEAFSPKEIINELEKDGI